MKKSNGNNRDGRRPQGILRMCLVVLIISGMCLHSEGFFKKIFKAVAKTVVGMVKHVGSTLKAVAKGDIMAITQLSPMALKAKAGAMLLQNVGSALPGPLGQAATMAGNLVDSKASMVGGGGLKMAMTGALTGGGMPGGLPIPGGSGLPIPSGGMPSGLQVPPYPMQQLPPPYPMQSLPYPMQSPPYPMQSQFRLPPPYPMQQLPPPYPMQSPPQFNMGQVMPIYGQS